MSEILKIYQVSKTYKNGFKALDNLSLSINSGEIFALLGPNGAGKSNSFYMVVGLVKPDTVNVYLNDKNITGVPMYKRAKMG